jgi:hypothetical protein
MERRRIGIYSRKMMRMIQDSVMVVLEPKIIPPKV